MDAHALPAPVAEAVVRWLRDHDTHAAGLIEGLYLVGSVALHDWRPGSDVDVVAFTAEPATDEDASALRAAHDAFVAGGEVVVEGPYLAWGDVTVPPTAVHRPWTLDRAFHHDGECFEINPVTWYSLATRGVPVRGEPTAARGVFLDRADRETWCRENLDTYWRNARDQVAAVLGADPGRTEFPSAVTEWCALGVARMWLTIETGAVASKTAAGEWARARWPDHAPAIDAAISARVAADPAAVVDRSAVLATLAWMAAAIDAL